MGESLLATLLRVKLSKVLNLHKGDSNQNQSHLSQLYPSKMGTWRCQSKFFRCFAKLSRKTYESENFSSDVIRFRISKQRPKNVLKLDPFKSNRIKVMHLSLDRFFFLEREQRFIFFRAGERRKRNEAFKVRSDLGQTCQTNDPMTADFFSFWRQFFCRSKHKRNN